MPSDTRARFLEALDDRYGPVKRMPGSRSLLEIGDAQATIYVRYSKLHGGAQAFFGLRKQDLEVLDRRASFIALLWDNQPEPVLIPYQDFSPLFQNAEPASDQQYKVQVYVRGEGLQLYIARAGRHNIEAYVGWDRVDRLLTATPEAIPPLTHRQVQTLLGAIGRERSLDVWIPLNDRSGLDWSIASPFECRSEIPAGFERASSALEQIDVGWIRSGSNSIEALYEVERSTPIYSGLLRFNDVQLVAPAISYFTIVSDDSRRDLFTRQLYRETFKASGLAEKCSFMTYREVYQWYERTRVERVSRLEHNDAKGRDAMAQTTPITQDRTSMSLE